MSGSAFRGKSVNRGKLALHTVVRHDRVQEVYDSGVGSLTAGILNVRFGWSLSYFSIYSTRI